MVKSIVPRIRGFASIVSPLLVFIAIITLCNCGSVTLYLDGNVNSYLKEPLPPAVSKPLAAGLNLEIVKYQTASSMKAIMISDLTAREIYILPPKVGKEVEDALRLDDEFSEESAKAGLNVVAVGRAKARNSKSGKKGLPTVDIGSSSSNYVRYNSERATEAYSKGDYLTGDIYNSAAINRMQIDASFSQAQSTANLAFGVLGAMAAAGEALNKAEYSKMFNWLANQSGAISPDGPKDRNLSVFFLRFFDAQKFKMDSRNRLTIMLVLTDETGIRHTVIEGSDVIVCAKDCDQFGIRSSAKKFDRTACHQDLQSKVLGPEGSRLASSNGFDAYAGIYEYILLKHALIKMQELVEKDGATD